MLPPFVNEPATDFSLPHEREAFEAALARVRSLLGRDWPLRIGGRAVTTGSTFESRNPAIAREIIGRYASARPEDVDAAVEAAVAAFPSWSRLPAVERAMTIARAAQILRRRKHEMSAWMVLEVGKTWPEADMDTAEAIDFCEFYAREALRLAAGHPLTPQPFEAVEQRYIALGVGLVIPPWNFPLAIACGMTAAALVTGNTVVLKPSSDAPGIANALVSVLEEAGVPAGALNLVTGGGAKIGDHAVDHPKIRFISFTGSKDIGIRINERAARVQPGQIWLKRVVAEMGGKDAIVVDASADLEAAATAIVASAFGFSGQKCSACSRAIVVGAAYDRVVDLVVEKARALVMGNPEKPGTQVGPVVNEKAYDKISGYFGVGRKDGRILLGGEGDKSEGWFLKPTVVADVPGGSRLSCEEIFGPVLAMTKAPGFEEAVALANATEYGLTGAAWSNDRAHLAHARERFHVGNLYLNRKCTGAMVGGHPFGGFNMSGTDSKAGGFDYLLLFLQAKSVAERLIPPSAPALKK